MKDFLETYIPVAGAAMAIGLASGVLLFAVTYFSLT